MNAFSGATTATVDDAYAEGILITRGSPRQHVWTYASADVANPSPGYTDDDTCLCTGHASAPQPPSFIGSDYYCDSGNDAGITSSGRLYSKELWNSQGPMCSVSASCCENPDQPWFKKKVAASVSDNIELRWCASESIVHEATATQLVELYIRVD